MLKKRLTALAAVAAVFVGLVVFPASPASAGDDLEKCKSGYVCLYRGSLADANFQYGTPGLLPNFVLPKNSTFYVVNNGNFEAYADHYYFSTYRNDVKVGSYCITYHRGAPPVDSGAWQKITTGSSSLKLGSQHWGGAC
ncbi:hypothetical protein [Glycomyces algeriensis]|uniref:Peptidase inhibitor family I36 n=1 Tax=Glycomyces algeriensis TaxID=256037 RepID=A0A9W6GCG2_9ACTN|nr:hypothetical protein [Glycomyces algeriensis]MDA1365729.1 hypothetical protein [Glycomyces algeriensis]MDR7351418.1 hypothetical protein [Glycomyces algeriensis]GLI44138.1 hypothetical protein GALLR39Z86_39880 [Glycomyces algeriensis]